MGATTVKNIRLKSKSTEDILHPETNVDLLVNDDNTKYLVPRPITKDANQTQPVGIDTDGKLYTYPSSTSGTTDYNELFNKPTVYQQTIQGDIMSGFFDNITPQLQESQPDSSKYSYWYQMTSEASSDYYLKNISLISGTTTLTGTTNLASNRYLTSSLAEVGSSELIIEQDSKFLDSSEEYTLEDQYNQDAINLN